MSPFLEMIIKRTSTPITVVSTYFTLILFIQSVQLVKPIRNWFTIPSQRQIQWIVDGLLAFFIHDLGKTSWETPADDALVPAASAMYVYGHGREGVMGDEPVAFTEKSRADAFIAKWGGQVYKYEEITLKRLD